MGAIMIVCTQDSSFLMGLEALVRGIDKGLCHKDSSFSTDVEALVRGIDKGLCPLSRRH